MKKKAWKHNGRELPWYVSFCATWPSRHLGRWMKRRLSKARRRAAKAELNGYKNPERGLASVESETNWKLW